MRYCRRSQITEAIKFTGDNAKEICNSFPDAVYPEEGVIEVPILNGVMQAVVGDYVTRNEDGVYYICKEGSFNGFFKKIDAPGFDWMKSWLKAYDKAHPGELSPQGIIDWIFTQPMGC